VWIANEQAAGSLSKLAAGQSTPLTPATGLGVLNLPAGIAVDGSGSVWTANAGDNTVSEFVGLAAPATVPLSANAGP
jgi:DNA-binding beta-propeller fold protein YncE